MGSLIFILLIQQCPFVFDSYQYLQPQIPVQQPQTTSWDSTLQAPLLPQLAAFSWMFSILSDQVHQPMEWIQMDWHQEQKRALKSMCIVLSSSFYVCICQTLCVMCVYAELFVLGWYVCLYFFLGIKLISNKKL